MDEWIGGVHKFTPKNNLLKKLLLNGESGHYNKKSYLMDGIRKGKFRGEILFNNVDRGLKCSELYEKEKLGQ